MLIRKSFLISCIFSIIIVSSFLIATPQYLDATIITSLAGDKDNFGTGAPLGSPLNSGIGINGIPIQPATDDGSFDTWKTKYSVIWNHLFTLITGEIIIGATLTIVTWDLEDGGAGDGQGGGPYDTKLYLDGLELIGAFDDTYSPDVGPSYPNITSFNLDKLYFNFLSDGNLTVTMNPSAGMYADAISIDYAELTRDKAAINRVRKEY